MRARPKPPTLVSMWMLDVFCCALGCVTLLWLLNSRVASDETRRAAAALADLNATRTSLLATRDDAHTVKRALDAEIDALRARLVATIAEKDDTARRLAIATADVAANQAKLATSVLNAAQLRDDLLKKTTDASDLTGKLAAASVSHEDLRKLLRMRETERDTAALTAKTAAGQLHDADAKLRALQKENADATANLAAMRKTGDDLATAKVTAKELQAKLDSAAANIIDLQGDKRKLADKIDRIKAESDTRFAGIAMTGSRVVFIVDMSGSMTLVDDKTPSPSKWPTVVETVTKVMRSLPTLEKYQIVIFSRQAKYLFNDNDWRTFDGENTIAQVRKTLMAIEPAGDTNMYDAFDLAFRLKPAGLDAVYFFSDGLPTSGVGLTAEQDKQATDTQKTEILSRHIRTTLRRTWNPPGGRQTVINSIGFFYESPEVGAFLWALSRENAGSFVGMSKP